MKLCSALIFVIVFLLVIETFTQTTTTQEAPTVQTTVRNVHGHLDLDTELPTQVVGAFEGVKTLGRKGRKSSFEFETPDEEEEDSDDEENTLSVRTSGSKKFNTLSGFTLSRKGGRKGASVSFGKDIMDESMDI
jgi:hypothetical protein